MIRRRLLQEWVEALQLAWEHDGDGPVSGEGYARLRMPIGTLDDIPSHMRDCGPSESHVLFGWENGSDSAKNEMFAGF